MKKETKYLDCVRQFKLAHQALCITGINFETESILGYVEMLIHPLKPDLKRIKINSKQCRIHRVSVNDHWETTFAYNDPTLEICQGDNNSRTLDVLETCQYRAMTGVDSDHGHGEVTIKMPQEAASTIADMKPFRIFIEFSLDHPKGGIRFVVPDGDGTLLERGAHLFTYKHENSSRLWFPCVDSYSEVCTWKLELTVDMVMTAVSCGDLTETVYTADLRKKTYHYFLQTPTSAPNIGLAVGPFEVFVDPHMHEVTHFCLPHLQPILRTSTTYFHKAFEYFEELLSSRTPYGCYKQVFVDQAYQECTAYASLSIINTNLLHPNTIIDQVPRSRLTMVHGVAQQFFGCFISINTWSDAWLSKGIAGYLTYSYQNVTFGNTEYRHSIALDLNDVQQFEAQHGGIILDPSATQETLHYFNTRHPHCLSPHYAAMYEKKARLVIRMLEQRIGREQFLMVLHKLLCLATAAIAQKAQSNAWLNMLLSTGSFLKLISSVTGKDVQMFMDQWVRQSGCARFVGSFVFNRKRNILELELKQETAGKGTMRYVGPLTVTIQELDGTFSHQFMIEDNKTKYEIICHSKSRRQKKKKIPLSTQEEVDMDLNDMDADSPVLWLRIDVDMATLRQVKLEQPDYMWHYMLRHERDVPSQIMAICAMERFPSAKTRLALTDTIENEKIFYRVRQKAAYCLAKVANSMVNAWAGPPAMLAIYRKFFGSPSCTTIVKRNNFSNFQHYFLQKTLPAAMASLRNIHGICPREVLDFILGLFKYNDNTKNKWADNYYRAELIDALVSTVTSAVAPVIVKSVDIQGSCPSTDLLSEETKLIMEEITRALNMEKLLPCYRMTVTVSCLKAFRRLQKFGHLPCDASIFSQYAEPGTFIDVRLAAIRCLVDFTQAESSPKTLYQLLDMVEKDEETPFVRNQIITMMIKQPMFKIREEHSLNTEELVHRLWNMMNCKFSHDSRLRCSVADLYHTLYGRTRPTCLQGPETQTQGYGLKSRPSSSNVHISVDDDIFQPTAHRFENDMISRPMSASVQPPDNFMEDDEDSNPLNPLKRCSTSPLHQHMHRVDSETIRHSSVNPNIVAVISEEDNSNSNSQFKFKIKNLNPEKKSSAPSSGHSSPGFTAQQYNEEFHRFAGMMPDPSRPAPPPPVSTQQQSTTAAGGMSFASETVTVSTNYEQGAAARLSEDSDSNSLPGVAPSTSGTPAPTSFNSSMFYNTPAPAITEETPTSSIPPQPSSDGKSHKKHKKEKKKKKKHKHKHKHEKKDKEGGGGVGGVSGAAQSSFNMDIMSSGRSNTNSQQAFAAPDSPEFEVM